MTKAKRSNRPFHLALIVVLTLLQAPGLSAWPASEGVWVQIDTQHNELTVFSGNKVVKRFKGIAIGRGGASDTHKKGDGSTPKGKFKVTWVNEDSPFRRFFGLNYPNRAHADAAYKVGRINKRQHQAILRALAQGIAPPSNTPLGGRIGIHGLGNADPRIHARFNWTQGCIALTNEQIDRLTHWLTIGTPVVIR